MKTHDYDSGWLDTATLGGLAAAMFVVWIVYEIGKFMFSSKEPL